MLERKPYNEKTDMFSLGIVIFECTFKKHPFYAETISEVHENILNKEIVIKESKNRTISDDLDDFLKRCLIKDPNKRMSCDEALLHPLIKDLNLYCIIKKKGL